MLRLYGGLFALTLIVLPAALSAQQSAATPAQEYDQLVVSTQLDRKGAPPFHLKIDAQLYDLKGKPTETGTIEEWWATPGEYRVEINSGQLHEVRASGEPHRGSQGGQDARSRYLLSQLLSATERPLQKSIPVDTITVYSHKFGEVDLDCFVLHLAVLLPTDNSAACADPGTEGLRLKLSGYETDVRNSLTTFYATNVALSTKIVYFGRDAVSGKISKLESFTPGAPGTPTLLPNPPVADAAEGSQARISGKVMSGRILKKVVPVYPPMARQNRIGGAVILHAIITREGKIGSLFVLASPDETLSGAAMSAVSAWRYQPYLLNGQPTEVDTTITVNFNLNGNSFYY
jgi:TonB family protein